ncbi:hypothetical protein PG996_009424 [Apiospora saccharicola]|uniref:Protein kinase domain-containing protein n=1 Tax=Apiospora saccharicola TaxID=335842 RepID=A0ABR1UNS1_9PEZI
MALLQPRPGIEPDNPFLAHVAKHRAIGRDGNENERPYIPSVSLQDYWEIEAIEFCVQAAQQHFVDTERIQKHYLRVLSTLVMINSVEYIKYFTQYGIDDTRLPLLDQPATLAAPSFPSQWWESFYNAQWQFCPVEFSLQKRLLGYFLDPKQIWPIARPEPMAGGQGEIVTSSKVTVDPRCIQLRGNKTKCVFKRYTSEGYPSFKNETEAYMKLSAHFSPSIVHCYEWFEQGDSYVIVLEYAEYGSLIEYWKGTHEPTQQEDINMLWTNFFEIFEGLSVIHSNIPHTQGRESLKMFGMHLDIKPGNILVFKKPGTSNRYDVQFKIADFGLSRTRPIINGQPNPIDRDPGGSHPPETTRRFDWTDSLPIQVGQSFDIWGMGCVFSEMVSWVVGGEPERERYRLQREAEIPMEVKDAGYSACFHDGDGPLPLIKVYHHPNLLNTFRIGDSQSFQVGQMVVRDMLIKEPAGRLNAQQLYRKAKNLEEEYPYLEVVPTIKVSKSDAQSVTYQRPSIVHSRDSSGETGDPFDFSPPRSSPGPEASSPLTPISGNSYHQSQPSYGSSTVTNRPYSHTVPDIAPTTSQPLALDHTYPFIRPLQVQTTPTKMAQRPFSQKLGTGGLEQLQEAGFHSLPITSQESISTRSTFSNTGGNYTLNCQRNGAGITPQSRTSTSHHLSEHVIEHSFTPLTHRTNSSRAAALGRQPTELQNSIDYTKILKWKAEKRNVFSTMSTMFGSSKTNSTSTPWRRRLDSAKATLGKRELIFIIDDSTDMRVHWEHVVGLFKALYSLVKPLDDDGVDVYFTSDPNRSFKEKSWTSTEKYIEKIEKRDLTPEPCPMEKCLSERFREINQAIDRDPASARRTSLFVLSNGNWAPNNEDPACGVAILIRNLVKKLASSKMDRFQVSLQFVRFNSNSDDIGTQRLAYLDDNIKEDYGLE